MMKQNSTAHIQTLSGEWMIARDPKNTGKANKWFLEKLIEGSKKAEVPGIIQQTFPDYHGVVWYSLSFIPQIIFKEDNMYFLKFSYVDYYAEIWLNGIYVGNHEGGEMPFDIDVTDVLRPDVENRLTVRVINPKNEEIDGIVLAETPHSLKHAEGIGFGAIYNYGGIIRPVMLASVPKVRTSDVFVRAELSGDVSIDLEMENDSTLVAESIIKMNLSEKNTGQTVLDFSEEILLPVGKTIKNFSFNIINPHLWELDDPFLYELTVTLETKQNFSTLRDNKKTRFGFKEFKIEKGFFRLNGNRIYVRSTHTAHHYPQGQIVPVNRDFLLKDLINLKASGFNMVRFISGTAFPEQLDLCDEIGLMVYEECYASWKLEDSEKMAERFDASTFGMIKRDRNHVCVSIWGLLNETCAGPVFDHAASCLEKLRNLDDTRLVLLSSGRWDMRADIGSVCNPYSTKWEFEWGEESQDNKKDLGEMYKRGLCKGMGDIHFYPEEPKCNKHIQFFRNLGKNTKPVYLSETGVGSQFDVIRTMRYFEQDSAREDLSDVYTFGEMEKRFLMDWEKYGMDVVYPFPGDMLIESQILQTRQRKRYFDIIRSNPHLCGYNLTGMLDQAFSGEGIWTFHREWKPGIVDVLQDGWAKLRWCLFTEETHVYAGRPFEVEAVLANDNVLKPGKYEAVFKIYGQNGVVWERETAFNIPEVKEGDDAPLAVHVFKENIILDVNSGKYDLCAYLKHGGAPKGEKTSFFLTNPNEYPQINREVIMWGIDNEICNWLNSKGITCRSIEESTDCDSSLILIGDVSESETEEWNKLLNLINSGSTAVFLYPASFQVKEDTTARLPLEKKGRCYRFDDWLYHKECVAKVHPYFENMHQKGALDNDYFGQVMAHDLFVGQDTPDETMAATFALGYENQEGYASGLLIGAYNVGAGRIVLNTMNILENIDKNPSADLLLLNLISYEKNE